MFQTKLVKKIETYILFAVTFAFFKKHATDEVMWKNILEPDRSQMTKRNMCIACWVNKATDTHFWNM